MKGRALAVLSGVVACSPAQRTDWPPPAPCNGREVASLAPPPAPPAEVLLVAAGAPCTREQLDLRGELRSVMGAVEANLRSAGFAAVTTLEEPDANELLRRLAAPRRRPLVVVFAGHGVLHDAPASPGSRSTGSIDAFQDCRETRRPCVSAICTGGELLDIDALVAAVPAQTPAMVLAVDACSSAHVDVRRARTRLSVASASTTQQGMNRNGSGFIAAALAGMKPAVVDADCDGWLTDIELFRWLSHGAPRDLEGVVVPPAPRLRRQAAAPIPLLRVGLGTRQGCTPSPGAEPLAAGSSIERSYPPHRRVVGCAEPADGRAPLPCAEDIGQCFRLED